jgi:hypothetical protein
VFVGYFFQWTAKTEGLVDEFYAVVAMQGMKKVQMKRRTAEDSALRD